MSSSLQKWAADECSSVRPLYFSQDGDPQFISSSEFVKAVQTALKRDGDSDESLQAAKDYIMSEMTTYIPIMAFAIIVFLAWCPLWCTRGCCPHKCCAPTVDTSVPPPTGHASRTRGFATAFFTVSCLMLIGFGIVGILAVEDVNTSTYRFSCAANDHLTFGESWAQDQGVNFTAAHDLCQAVDANLEATRTAVTCLQDTNNANPCQLYTNIRDQVTSTTNVLLPVDASLCDPGTACAEVRQLSSDAADAVCAAFSSSQSSELDSVHSSIDSIQSTIDQYVPVLEYASEVFTSAGDNLHDAMNTIGDLWTKSRDANPDSYTLYVGLFCFGGSFIALLFGIGGVLLMGWQCCRREGCGVQLSGCSWVFASIAPFYYFFVAAILFTLTNVAFYSGDLAQRSPTQVVELYGDTTLCPQETQSLSYASGAFTFDGCGAMNDILSSCWGPDPPPLIDAVTEAVGFNLTVDELSDTIAQRNSEIANATDALLSFNVTTGDEDGDAALAYTAPLSAVALGVTCCATTCGAQCTQVDADLANIVTDMTNANAVVQNAVSCYDDLERLAPELTDQANTLQTTTVAQLKGAQCDWAQPRYNDLLGEYYVLGSSARSINIALIGAGAASVLLIGATIAMQIIYGRVGQRPAKCPCCAGPPVPPPKLLVADPNAIDVYEQGGPSPQPPGRPGGGRSFNAAKTALSSWRDRRTNPSARSGGTPGGSTSGGGGAEMLPVTTGTPVVVEADAHGTAEEPRSPWQLQKEQSQPLVEYSQTEKEMYASV